MKLMTMLSILRLFSYSTWSATSARVVLKVTMLRATDNPMMNAFTYMAKTFIGKIRNGILLMNINAAPSIMALRLPRALSRRFINGSAMIDPTANAAIT
ncbi:hypothetical protein SDC9_106264 [bioreactor metagenome]|uniref:Uncharacterized protein n=1 Tax=bioreactor metagenome TaxID=1076179 RepID=A0A645B1U4_9ZZZZ